MIIFLYGEDTYRSRQKLKEIVDKYKEKHKSGLNLKFIDSFKDNVRQTSMFKEKKLFVAVDSFSNPEFKKEFIERADSFKEDSIIFLEESVSKNDSLFKFLKKNAKCQEFNYLAGQKLKAWAAREFEIYNAKIDSIALDRLLFYTGSDLWRLSNEIMKLACYNSQVSEKDVRLLVRPKIENDIFKTIDAVAIKDKKQALELLHKHIEKGDTPFYLLSMINYQFRNILLVKDYMEKRMPYELIVKKSNLHPYVAKKSYFQSQKFSFEELKKIYHKIFQVDWSIKTGKLEPEAALDLFVSEI